MIMSNVCVIAWLDVEFFFQPARMVGLGVHILLEIIQTIIFNLGDQPKLGAMDKFALTSHSWRTHLIKREQYMIHGIGNCKD